MYELRSKTIGQRVLRNTCLTLCCSRVIRRIIALVFQRWLMYISLQGLYMILLIWFLTSQKKQRITERPGYSYIHPFIDAKYNVMDGVLIPYLLIFFMI